MQRHLGQLHTARSDCAQQRIAEVQARRRRRNGSRSGGIAGLIAAVVVVAVLMDVGRQRHRAVAGQQGLDRLGAGAIRRKAHHTSAAGRIDRHDLQADRRLIRMLQLQHLARLQTLGGPGQAEPVAGGDRFEYEQLHSPPAGAPRL